MALNRMTLLVLLSTAGQAAFGFTTVEVPTALTAEDHAALRGELRRILEDPEQLQSLAAAYQDQLDEAFATPMPVIQLDEGLVAGLQLEDVTKRWVPSALGRDRGKMAAIAFLRELGGRVGASDTVFALENLERDLVAVALAKAAVAEFGPQDPELWSITEATAGVSRVPVVAVALLHMKLGAASVVKLLAKYSPLDQPWESAAVAMKVTDRREIRRWLERISSDELLAIAEPSSPYDGSIREEALSVLTQQVPDNDWEAMARARMREQLPPFYATLLSGAEDLTVTDAVLEILWRFAVSAAIFAGTEDIASRLMGQLEDDPVLSRAVLMENPQVLAPTKDILDLVATVEGTDRFFLQFLERLPVMENERIVSVAGRRVRDRDAVIAWISHLEGADVEYLALSAEAIDKWIAKAAQKRWEELRSLAR